MKRGQLPPRSTPIRRMSARRTSERATRRDVVERVRLRDRACKAATIVVGIECGGPLDVHEIIPRSAWAQGYLEPDNCLLVCRRHHDWIGAHPTQAHQAGLHGYSWERTT